MKNILIILLLCPVFLFGQSNDKQPIPTEASNALLEFISGPSDKERDWEQFKSLFEKDAKFCVLQHAENLPDQFHSFSVDQFISIIKRNLKAAEAFEEKEISSTYHEYNGIAQVFQSYELNVGDKNDRGINSYQMIYKDGQWKIVNILWVDNTNGVKIPEAYLPSSEK